MTPDEVSAGLIMAGGKEYPHPTLGKDGARLFEFRRKEGPACETNDRPPAIHVTVWPDFQGHRLGVEFEICGEYGGEWVKMQIYSVDRERAVDFLPKAQRVLAMLWATYCQEMKV